MPQRGSSRTASRNQHDCDSQIMTLESDAMIAVGFIRGNDGNIYEFKNDTSSGTSHTA